MFGTSRKSSTSTITPKPKHTPQKSDQSPKFQNPSTGVPEEVMDTLKSLQDSMAKMNLEYPSCLYRFLIGLELRT